MSIFTRGKVVLGIPLKKKTTSTKQKQKKKEEEKRQKFFTTSSVQILETSIQCVVVDMHIDQALKKRKQFKVKCNHIFVLIKSTDTNIMKQTKGPRSATL